MSEAVLAMGKKFVVRLIHVEKGLLTKSGRGSNDFKTYTS